ncbi:MAG: hypothetical protein Q4E89_07485 [Eubacteriales bacterium]|nr:hypothetical protein [Eubacteriales bacterium]
MSHKKNVRIFRQNQSMETCVCCCILMVLDYYYKLPGVEKYPTRKMETTLYQYLGYRILQSADTSLEKRFTRGTPLSAAAYYLSERGLTVCMYHSEKEYLNNNLRAEPYYPVEVFPEILEKYKYWINKADEKVIQKTCTEVQGNMLADILERGEIVIAACTVDSDEGETLHGILIDSYYQEAGRNIFHVCNPATGKHTITEEELRIRMNTPVGIHFMTVSLE